MELDAAIYIYICIYVYIYIFLSFVFCGFAFSRSLFLSLLLAVSNEWQLSLMSLANTQSVAKVAGARPPPPQKEALNLKLVHGWDSIKHLSVYFLLRLSTLNKSKMLPHYDKEKPN